MGVPPELMAALQQAGAPADPASGPADPAGGPYGPDPSGLPQQIMDGINQDASGGQQKQPTDFLQDAIAALDGYSQAEQDAVDLAEGRKIAALIQKLLAKDQQEQDAALGVTPAHRGMAKAYGVGPAATGP